MTLASPKLCFLMVILGLHTPATGSAAQTPMTSEEKAEVLAGAVQQALDVAKDRGPNLMRNKETIVLFLRASDNQNDLRLRLLGRLGNDARILEGVKGGDCSYSTRSAFGCLPASESGPILAIKILKSEVEQAAVSTVFYWNGPDRAGVVGRRSLHILHEFIRDSSGSWIANPRGPAVGNH